jgi:DNA-binding CsgD family transcriptional regulator
VAVSERAMLANALAARRLEPGDRDLLWDWVARTIANQTAVPGPIVLASGTWTVKRVQPVRDGSVVIGAILRLGAPATFPEGATVGGGPAAPSDRPRFGWGSVTVTEMRVAELVAQGMTNREIAGDLYLSPHTVSFHIRQIFRKLDISSRVELTRLLVEGQTGVDGD